MKEMELLKDYFTRVMEVINQMKTYGETISSQRIVEKILISLPEKYDPVVAVIEQTKDLATLGIEELMGSIKAFKQRLNLRSEKSVESAFQSKLNVGSRNQEKNSSEESFRGRRNTRGRGGYARGRGRGRSNFTRQSNEESTQQRCRICQRKSHDEKDCWFRGKPQCHNCKRFGHIQKECDLNKIQQANFTEEKESNDHLFYACQVATEQKDDVWFLDSGCSNHMTGQESIFKEIGLASNSEVKMGNGAALVKAKAKGTISVETKKGTKDIQDVLLVPDLAQNLLSVGQLLEHGYVVHFEDLSCKIYDQRRREVANIKMEKNRSFPLTFSYKNVALKADVVGDSWLCIEGLAI
ncbi:hypothetical protein ACHQM5_000836 [Ranunculus cassubicifolius]